MATKESLEPALNNFAEVARRYCDWVEGEFRDPRQALREARLLLAELQLAAVRLPTTDSVGEEEAIGLSPEEWSHFFRKFSDLPLNGYWDVSNPIEETKPTFHSLADDLAEIYQQVKAGLSLFDKQHYAESAWEWRFNFQVNWGRHLVSAQRALYQYLSDEDI